MNRRCGWATLLSLGAVIVGCQGGSPGPAEVNVLTGPRFWTGDPARPWADALLVSQGKIFELLSEGQVPQRLAQGGTLIQLPGTLAVPGLTDAHGHIFGFGLAQRRAQLAGASSLEETLARVSEFAALHPQDAWVLGRGWDQNDWPDRTWPDADRLEQSVPGRPCALWRVDGHALWVNRTALAVAGITAATPDPRGGSIHRDASHRPTGVLVDNAVDLVSARIPKPDRVLLEEALEVAGRELLSLGLTGVHEMGLDDREWAAMEKLARAGRFPLRVTAYAEAASPLARTLILEGPREVGRLRLAGIKYYADGALGSRGARLLQPYADESSTTGLWVTGPEELRRQVLTGARRGLQPAIHAIGDAAVRAALSACSGLQKMGAPADLRPRVEHAQIVDPADIPVFSREGVVASMQPTHATSDMPWAEERLGAERLAGAYAWRSLLDSRAALAFGSDYPIESPDPRGGLFAAVTRRDQAGRPPGGWRPEQALTLEEALRAFTQGAAYAAHQEKMVGLLKPGMWCDLTVFGGNVFELPPEAWLKTKVTATVIGGQVVFPFSH